jgi:hypothetical protein
MDVVLSVAADGWNKWGEKFVKRQPQSRVQHLIGAHPGVAQAKAAVLKAIGAAGSGGRVIINVGHGAGGGNLRPTEGKFELAPGGAMTLAGRGVLGAFVDVFYDVNVEGPPYTSDLNHDLTNNPGAQRLKNFRVYQDLSKAFKNAHLREVVLLTCRVGNSTEFLRKVANDWGVVIRAFRQRVALIDNKPNRYLMYLENRPPKAGASDKDLAVMAEEIPYAPSDTFLVGPPL